MHVCVLKLKHCKFVINPILCNHANNIQYTSYQGASGHRFSYYHQKRATYSFIEVYKFQNGFYYEFFSKRSIKRASSQSSELPTFEFPFQAAPAERQATTSKFQYEAFSPTSSLVSTLFLICRESLGTCSSPTCFIRLCCLETRVGNKVR